MTKRAGQRSNMARIKIREQLALLKKSKPRSIPHAASAQILPSKSIQPKTKVHYDTSLVDLIDSIENDSEKVSIKNPMGQSLEMLQSSKRSSKVYYPRHQLLKTMQQN